VIKKMENKWVRAVEAATWGEVDKLRDIIARNPSLVFEKIPHSITKGKDAEGFTLFGLVTLVPLPSIMRKEKMMFVLLDAGADVNSTRPPVAYTEDMDMLIAVGASKSVRRYMIDHPDFVSVELLLFQLDHLGSKRCKKARDEIVFKHLPQRQRHLECAHVLAWVMTRGIPGNIWVDMAELVVKRWLAGFKTNWE
jgi:hypothetical protein